MTFSFDTQAGLVSSKPMDAIVVGLGGNVGGREVLRSRLCYAIERISEKWGAGKVSGLFVSSPIGPVQDQPDFVNAVAAWWPQTRPSPEKALALLQEIEEVQGRERSLRGGARTLDLDLLLHAGEVRTSELLMVPHPRMAQRAFVLRPLAELFGTSFSWHGCGASVAELLRNSSVATQNCSRLGSRHLGPGVSSLSGA